MSDAGVRPLREEEVDDLIGLWFDFSAEMAALDPYNELADGDVRGRQRAYRREALVDDDRRVWVGTDGDDLVGYVTAEYDASPPVFARGDAVTVTELFVREPYRGEGLADRLLDRAVAWGRERGCERVSLSVNVDNERARAFYERRGFEPRRLTLDRPLE